MTELSIPRRAASLSAQLVDTLREHIASGKWPVGTRLPTEHELMAQLGVGRTTVREALGALTHLGLLDSRVGDGTYVRSSSELHSVLIRRARRFSQDHVLELRSVLESHASEQAARHRTDADVERMRSTMGAVDTAIEAGRMDRIIAADAEFHEAIVAAGGNPLIAEVYSDLGDAVAEVLDGTRWDGNAAREHARLHHLLLSAIANADATSARAHAIAIVELNMTTGIDSEEDARP